MTNIPSLIIKRVINAPCEEVFAAWSRPEIMNQWFFPMRAGWKANTKNNFKVGGEYKHDMVAEDGTVFSHTGIYKEIISNQKIVFTWNSCKVKNTLVTIQLQSIRKQTEITLLHEFLSNEEEYINHKNGWHECFEHLNKYLVEEINIAR